jgi:hypothetical protein
MSEENMKKRKDYIISKSDKLKLLDFKALRDSRVIDKKNNSVCPLCLKEISSDGFFTKVKQAEGREVHDLTVTNINLFHVNELKYGVYNHKPYNVGWGHHHCNVVAKDSGISDTLNWLNELIQRNISEGMFAPKRSS